MMYMGLLWMVVAVTGSLLIVAAPLLFSKSPWYALGFPLGLAAAVFAFTMPESSVLVLIGLIPLDFFSEVFGQESMLSVFKVLAPLVAAAGLIRFVIDENKSFSLTTMDRWLLIWILYNLFLMLLAVDKRVALDTLLRDIGMWIIYFLVSKLMTSPLWQQRLVKVILFTAILSTLMGIKSYISGTNVFSSLQDPSLMRITGATTMSPNQFALLLFMPFALSSFLAITTSGWKRVCYALIAALMTIGVLLTFSRSGALAFAAMLPLLVFRARKRLSPSGILVAVMAVLILLVAAPTAFWNRMGSLLEPQQRSEDTSLMRRENYLVTGLNIIETYPLFGCGPGNFPVLHADSRFQEEPSLIGVPRKAHNLYLTVVTETGVVGFLLFVGLLAATAKKSYQAASQMIEANPIANALLVSFCGFLAMGLFAHLQQNKYLWVLFGFINVLNSKEDTQ